MKSAVVVQVEGALSICTVYIKHVLIRFTYLLSASRCFWPQRTLIRNTKHTKIILYVYVCVCVCVCVCIMSHASPYLHHYYIVLYRIGEGRGWHVRLACAWPYVCNQVIRNETIFILH